MKQVYMSPQSKVLSLSADRCISVSIGGSTESYPSEYPDGGLFESLDDKGELAW